MTSSNGPKSRQQRARRRHVDDWKRAKERARSDHAARRERAIHEGRLAEYEADPARVHPDDVRCVDTCLRAALRGCAATDALPPLLNTLAMTLGAVFDQASFIRNLVEAGTAIEHAARRAKVDEHPFLRVPIAAGTLGAGTMANRLHSAFNAADASARDPATVAHCLAPLVGYAIGTVAAGEADLQRGLSLADRALEQSARRMFHLAQAHPEGPR
jgi:hypothetical protein